MNKLISETLYDWQYLLLGPLQRVYIDSFDSLNNKYKIQINSDRFMIHNYDKDNWLYICCL